MNIIYERCDKEDTIIIGDFNIGKDVEFEDVCKTGYIDCWPSVHKEEKGNTYDPQNNSFASTSRVGEAIRVDRMLLKSNIWKTKEIKLFGEEQIEVETKENTKQRINLSDHFGILTKFEIEN